MRVILLKIIKSELIHKEEVQFNFLYRRDGGCRHEYILLYVNIKYSPPIWRGAGGQMSLPSYPAPFLLESAPPCSFTIGKWTKTPKLSIYIYILGSRWEGKNQQSNQTQEGMQAQVLCDTRCSTKSMKNWSSNKGTVLWYFLALVFFFIIYPISYVTKKVFANCSLVFREFYSRLPLDFFLFLLCYVIQLHK